MLIFSKIWQSRKRLLQNFSEQVVLKNSMAWGVFQKNSFIRLTFLKKLKIIIFSCEKPCFLTSDKLSIQETHNENWT